MMKGSGGYEMTSKLDNIVKLGYPLEDSVLEERERNTIRSWAKSKWNQALKDYPKDDEFKLWTRLIQYVS